MLGLPASVDKVVRFLREDILRGRLRAGERLPSERDLVDRVGVNRGAVREALRTLTQLGLIENQPGGARVAPVDEASLDVIEHLFELDELPSLELVAQVMEAAGILVSGCALLFAERADDDALARVRALARRLGDERLPDPEQTEALHEMMHRIVDGSGNYVLRLVRKAVRLHFTAQIREVDALGAHPPADRKAPILRALDAAFAKRDGEGASRALRALIEIHRSHVLRALERAHADHGGGLAPAVFPPRASGETYPSETR